MSAVLVSKVESEISAVTSSVARVTCRRLAREDAMPIPTPLEYVIERLRRHESEVERRRLRALAGVDVPAVQARELWPRLLDHKWFMSERMGRDVGLRVAAIDFFEHVEPRPIVAPQASLILARAHAVGRAVFVEPVVWLHRVLSDFTETLRGVSAFVGIIL